MTDRPPHVNYGTTYVATPVRLVDGTVVLSDSPEWRRQCEAQHILNLPNKQARKALLSTIEEKRGNLARLDLERRIMDLWTAQQRSRATA